MSQRFPCRCRPLTIPLMPSSPLLALRYMRRFRCIAERCEDTCCAGLNVFLSAEDRGRLERALGSDPAHTAELESKLRALPEQTDRFVAMLAKQPDRRCAFLEPTLLCSVVRRFGDDALPDACALFPRVLSSFPDRLEVVGSLSCPEAARLCLLADDSVELDAADASLVSRSPPAQGPAPKEPYGELMELVRSGVLRLLSEKDVGLEQRLVRLAAYADGIGDFYHRGAPPSAPGLAREREQIGQALATARAAQMEPTEGAARQEQAVTTVLGVLFALNPLSGPRFQRTLAAALASYQRDAQAKEPALGQPGGPALAGALARAYGRRRDLAPQNLRRAIDRYLTRYLINECYREWHTRSATLLAYVFKLLLSTVCVRLLLLGQPAAEGLIPELSVEPGVPLGQTQREALESAVVETVQTFCRQFELRPELLGLLESQVSLESTLWTARERAMTFALLA
jgi:lysine-N-methylase